MKENRLCYNCTGLLMLPMFSELDEFLWLLMWFGVMWRRNSGYEQELWVTLITPVLRDNEMSADFSWEGRYIKWYRNELTSVVKIRVPTPKPQKKIFHFEFHGFKWEKNCWFRVINWRKYLCTFITKLHSFNIGQLKWVSRRWLSLDWEVKSNISHIEIWAPNKLKFHQKCSSVVQLFSAKLKKI